MSQPLRILIMNRKYDRTVGGVEKISVAIANNMVARGHKCHIVSLDLPESKMYFDLSPEVVWHKISTISAANKAGWRERIARYVKLRKIMIDHKIDVAVGFQDGAYLSLMTAALGTGVFIVAAERNAPSRFEYMSDKGKRKFVYRSFQLADAVTVQCPSYVVEYPESLRHKIHVIANPVMRAAMSASPGADKPRNTILFAGRFDYQKNLEILVEAFSYLAPKYETWDLSLVGGGEYEERLTKKVKDLGLSGRISLAGPSKNLETRYAEADIFVLPSLWEGFPNALAEAMAHGLPCVGMEKCSGVRDLIEHGKSGFLSKGSVNDARALAGTLEILMDDACLRKNMGDYARSSMAQYEPERVYNQWNDLFLRLVRR